MKRTTLAVALLSGFLAATSIVAAAEEFSLQVPATQRPTTRELRAEFPWVKNIERDSSPTNAVTLTLKQVLRSDESYVNGSEYERRIAQESVLGYQQAAWLTKNQNDPRIEQALSGLRQLQIDFPGTVAVSWHGTRSIAHLRRCGELWCLSWTSIVLGFEEVERGRRLAIGGK